MYSKIETERMTFMQQNQKKLRTEEYIHLRDAIINDRNVHNIGILIHFPSTYIESPRHMHEYTQDAITNVWKHGHPDLFIAFIYITLWPKIKEI